jgi:hypothetical protein
MGPLTSIIIVAACLNGPSAVDIIEKVALAPNETPVVDIIASEPECFAVGAQAPDHRYKYKVLARYDTKGGSWSAHETPQTDGSMLYLVTIGPEMPNT